MVSFDELLRLQDESDLRLALFEIDLSEYNNDWKELLSLCGYTQQEYEDRIDRRWDVLFSWLATEDVFTNYVWSLQSGGQHGFTGCYLNQHVGVKHIMSEEREQRNQVFNKPEGVDQRIQQVTAADKIRSEFNLDIPTEVVPLPSGGKTYPKSHPLHGLEEIEISPMTAREEDILTSKAYLKKGTVISELIKSCVIDKGVNPSDMLIGDRNALMMAIRITGYGHEYDAEVQCAECDVKSKQQFNLAALPLKKLEIEPLVPGTNEFQFMLPFSKKNVSFKFLAGRDEEEINATTEKQKKLGLNSDASVTTGLIYSILSIDGITDRAKIASFCRFMPARDSLALRNYMRDNEPGVSMKQEVSCPACGHVEEVTMPMGVSFLWPSAAR